MAICRDLIRIDTTNPGDHSGPGERKAAEYVAGLLAEVGLQPAVLESHPKRTSLVARIEGTDKSKPALLIHGHLDVVPANASDWRQDPFGGEIADGCVWGRGAVDMKDMDAIMLAVVRQRLREGRKPARDVVLAFTADEEAGGNWGAGFLVEQHADLFEGVTEAIGEVGGFSVSVGDQRLYAVQTAEKGLAWMRLTATGHGGARVDDPQRQRGHHARGGRRQGGQAPVANPAPGRDARRSSHRQRKPLASTSTRRTRPASSASSAG